MNPLDTCPPIPGPSANFPSTPLLSLVSLPQPKGSISWSELPRTFPSAGPTAEKSAQNGLSLCLHLCQPSSSSVIWFTLHLSGEAFLDPCSGKCWSHFWFPHGCPKSALGRAFSRPLWPTAIDLYPAEVTSHLYKLSQCENHTVFCIAWWTKPQVLESLAFLQPFNCL